MRALKIPRREAIGIVTSISSWCLANNRSGGVFEKFLIPDAVEWEGDPAPLIAALLDLEGVKAGASGWLDELGGDLVKVHDWEHITKGFIKAQKDAEKRTIKNKVARGELPEGALPAKQVKPDRSSSPEALAAEAYLTWNKNATMSRNKIVWEFQTAKKTAEKLGDTGFMERLHTACMDQKQCENVGVWDLLKTLLPKDRAELRADELLAEQKAAEKARQAKIDAIAKFGKPKKEATA